MTTLALRMLLLTLVGSMCLFAIPTTQGQQQTPSSLTKTIIKTQPTTTAARLLIHPDIAPAATSILMQEGFEHVWPTSGWTMVNRNPVNTYSWAKRFCPPHTGMYGETVALLPYGGGAGCLTLHPNNASVLAIYGPFDLSTSTAASLTFYLYGRTSTAKNTNGDPLDSLFVGSSINGQNFAGTPYFGDYTQGSESNSYTRLSLDLTDRIGQSQVWITFWFESDATGNDIGFTIDDLTLERTEAIVPRRFDVARDGLSFANFSYLGNTSAQAWEQFKKAFPGTQMELPDGQHRKGPEAFFSGEDYQTIGDGGNCAGFTAVSLIRYLGLPETVEPSLLSAAHRAVAFPSDWLAGVPGNVTVGQSDVKDYIHLYQARQKSYQFNLWWAEHGNDTPIQTYQAVQRLTQANEPVALSISQPGLGGHRITAYRTEQSGTLGYIHIYDNNYPGDSTRRVTVNLTTNQWLYEVEPGKTWGGGAYLRYSPVSLNFPAELPLEDATAALNAVTGQNGTIVAVSGDSSLLIRNAQGQMLGYQNGNLVSTIPGATALFVDAYNPTAPNAPASERYFLPNSATYTVTVQPQAANSIYTLSAFGGGSAMRIADVSAATGSTDELVLKNTVLDSTFTPATDGAYCHYLTREVNTENSRDYTVCITDGRNVPATVTLDPATNRESFQHWGTESVAITLDTTQIGSLPGQATKRALVAPGEIVTGPPARTTVYLPAIRR